MLIYVHKWPLWLPKHRCSAPFSLVSLCGSLTHLDSTHPSTRAISPLLCSLTSMNMTPKSLLPSSVLRFSQVSAPRFWLSPRFLQQVAPFNLKLTKSTVEMVIFPTQLSSSVLLMLKTPLSCWSFGCKTLCYLHCPDLVGNKTLPVSFL